MYDDPKYSSLRDSGFSWFYMFINIGAIFAPPAAVGVRNWWLSHNGFAYNPDLPGLCHGHLAGTLQPQAAETYQTLANEVSGAPVTDLTQFANDYLNVFSTGFHYAFAVAIVAMLVSLVIYVVNKKRFPDPSKKVADKSNDYLNVFSTGFHYAFAVAIVAMLVSLVIYVVNKKRFPDPSKKVADKSAASAATVEMSAQEVKQRIMALFAVFGVVIFFWFSFHQNGLTLTFFAKEYTDLNLFGMPITAELFQSLNPFFVVFLTPVVMAVFARQRARGKEPSTPKKIAIGMGIAATGFIIMAVGSFVSDLPLHQDIVAAGTSPVKVTPLLLMATYLVLTIAELYISPLGISFVSKVAPPKYQGIMQGGWLGATAIGNQLLFIGAVLYESIPIWMTWTVFVVACCISMCTMLFMLKWLERVAK